MKKTLFSLFLFVIAACVGNEHSGAGTKSDTGAVWQTGRVVDLDKECAIPLFDLVDSIEVVQLETNNQCLISWIAKVLFCGDRYYTLDVLRQTVFCFDRNGRFIRKISGQGRGPKEYVNMEDIAIDPYNDQLLLVDGWGSVLCFDLEGNYITTFEIPEAGAINEVHVLDSDRWLFVSLYEEPMLYFSKKEGRIVERLYERYVFQGGAMPVFRTYSYNDSIYFSPLFSNELLNMSDSRQQVAFSWDFGAKNNQPKQIKKLLQELNDLRKQSESAYTRGRDFFREGVSLRDTYLNYYIRYTRESSRYIMAILEYKNDYMHVIYDKQARKTVVFRETQEGIRWSGSRPFMYNQDLVIAYDIDGVQAKRYANEIFSPAQLQIVESHTLDDNPFLVVYHLKK